MSIRHAMTMAGFEADAEKAEVLEKELTTGLMTDDRIDALAIGLSNLNPDTEQGIIYAHLWLIQFYKLNRRAALHLVVYPLHKHPNRLISDLAYQIMFTQSPPDIGGFEENE